MKFHAKRLSSLYPSIPLIIPPYYTPSVFPLGSYNCLVSDFYALLDHNKGIWKYLQDPRMSLKQVSKSYRSFLDQFLTSSCGNVKTTLLTTKSAEISIPLLRATLSCSKIIFTSQNVSKSFQTCLTGQKKTEAYLKLIHRG